MTKTVPEIVVLGDFAWQIILTPSSEEKDRFERHANWVGMPLIQKMITNAIKRESSFDEKTPKLDPDVDKAKVIEASTVFIAELGYYPKASGGGKQDPVLRLARDIRAKPRWQGTPPSPALKQLKSWISATPSKGPRLAVIYDRGLDLREALDPLKVFLNNLTVNDSVVLAIEDDLEDDWLEELVGSIGKKCKQTIVLITADSLRKYGLPIVEYGSIEQAVRDVVGHLDKPPLNFLSDKGRHLVVVFRESAALHLHRTPDGKWPTVTGTTHYCPNWDRSAQRDPKRYGTMPGKLWIMLAAVVKQIYADWGNHDKRKDLGPAIRLGVAAFNRYSKSGFNANDPFKSIKDALGAEALAELKEEIGKKNANELLLSSLEFEGTQADIASNWRRIDSISCGFKPYDKDTLRKIVTNGVNAAFRHSDPSSPKGERLSADSKTLLFPGYAITCPYLEFGDIKTVDDREIASFLDLARIIYKYMDNPEWDKPLSIAVFGPPGSGKGFAVKQILKAVSPGSANREPLTFNLAQFSKVDQLTDAFHLVQDRVLSGESVPLVIFDEFDSDFDGAPLGWLKYFLAPMQDGLFRGQAQDYRVGRAIFLFSGGTASRFADFQEKLHHDPEKRKQVKINDFLSRLRGHLDILSINPREEDDKSKKRLVKIRRAMLLRMLLMQHAKPILRPAVSPAESVASIQDEVIDRFLHEWDYRHGVRSMEAVIQTSRWIDGRFVLASLPAETLLASHVVECGKSQAESNPES